ncbi:WD40-repeat-containing [Desulfonema limicola]|uniref:WD40-repeat-containing n=1 Tax=Desulfonema limicola TaxID=45656 RepID=A0A975GF16_9BACT|nr:hypothetical protein [Desulfonema limicola]QTA78705.1 WD40-repeat-containing [Desulfonema limicola]
MTNKNDTALPVLREAFLPVLLPDLGPQHKQAVPRFSDWKSLVHQRHVRDVLQCSQTGDLWVANSGGVLRWYPEHKQFTRYTSEHGLPGNNIAAIIQDSSGNVYCAPDYGGLYLFEDDGWILIGDKSYETLPIRCLSTDSKGQIRIGAKDGIYKVEDRIISLMTAFPSIETPRSMAVTENGDIWACYSLGLFLFREKMGPKLLGKQPTLLALACHGKKLWVGKTDGLVLIDLETTIGNKEVVVIQDPKWPVGTITALLPMPEGLYLVCDNHFGLLPEPYLETGWEPLCTIKGHCSRITVDAKGVIWIATHTGLLNWSESKGSSYLETQKMPDMINWTDFYSPNSYPSGSYSPVFYSAGGKDLFFGNLILCLALEQGQEGSGLWVATQQGLFQYSPEEYDLANMTYHPVDGIRDIQAMTAGIEKDEIWLSGFTGGVYSYSQSGSVEKMPGISVPVLFLTTGLHNTRWAVGTDGLYFSRDNRWEQVLSDSQLPAGSVLRSVSQTQDDQIWLGTTTGLICFHTDNQKITIPQDHPFTLPVNAISYDTASKVLWAGTEAGLYGLQQKGDGWTINDNFRLTAANSGLASDNIISLVIDESEAAGIHLWIGTSCGLSRFQYQVR